MLRGGLWDHGAVFYRSLTALGTIRAAGNPASVWVVVPAFMNAVPHLKPVNAVAAMNGTKICFTPVCQQRQRHQAFAIPSGSQFLRMAGNRL